MKLWRRAERISGFLDHETSVTGELQFSGTLRIDGSFHGSIASDDILVIGERAVVHADIKVGEIEIHGQVFGNVDAKRRAQIFATGCLRGDLQAPNLMVQAGALLDGRSSMASQSAMVQSDVRESTRLIEEADDRKRGIDLRTQS